MAVCKFFLQGKCKFGDKCRNEHPSNAGPTTQASFVTPNHATTPGGVTSNQQPRGGQVRQRGGQRRGPFPRELGLNEITKKNVDIELRQERPQWVMSAFAPGPNFPAQLFGGYPLEQSFEEVRFDFYSAVAIGNQQEAIQNEQDLAVQANQQVATALQDLDGALWYLVDEMNSHPNRRDILNQATDKSQPRDQFSVANMNRNRRGGFNGRGRGGRGGFQRGNTETGFGGPPNGFSGPAFGQTPNILNNQANFNAFNQQQQQQQRPPQLNNVQSGGFGGFATHQDQPQNNNTFTQQAYTAVDAPMLTAPSPAFENFSQPSEQGNGPQGFLGVQSPSLHLNQFSRPDALTNNTGFGISPANSQPVANMIPSAPTSNFSQIGASNLAAVQPSNQPQPVTMPSQVSDSASTETPAVTRFSNVNEYTTRSGNQLLTWKGKPVQYINGNPCFQRGDGGWERIWFPDGPPAQNTSAPSAEYSPETLKAYEHLQEHGTFLNGIMPEQAPSPSMIRYDI